MEVWPGQRYPLGATYDGTGTNFAIFSEVGTRVELCLFDAEGREEKVDLIEVDAHVWHGYIGPTESADAGSTLTMTDRSLIVLERVE